MQINAILFDFFGTLVDYTPGQYFKSGRKKAFNFLKSHGVNIPYNEFANSYVNTYLKLDTKAKQDHKEFHMYTLIEEMIQDNPGISFDKSLMKEFVDLYLEEWNLDVMYFPEIKDFIKKLSSQYKLGIITNTHFPSLIHNHLKKIGIQNYFQVVVTSVEFGFRKPNVEIFLYGAKQIGVKPQNVLFIGDSYRDDYEGALSAQMEGVLIDKKGKFSLIKNRINNLFELEKFL